MPTIGDDGALLWQQLVELAQHEPRIQFPVVGDFRETTRVQFLGFPFWNLPQAFPPGVFHHSARNFILNGGSQITQIVNESPVHRDHRLAWVDGDVDEGGVRRKQRSLAHLELIQAAAQRQHEVGFRDRREHSSVRKTARDAQ